MREMTLRNYANKIPTFQVYDRRCERLVYTYPNLPDIEDWGLVAGSRAQDWLVLECSDDTDWDPISDMVFVAMCSLLRETTDRSAITGWSGMKPILLWVMSGEKSVDRLARIRYVRSVQLWSLRKKGSRRAAKDERLWVPVQIESFLRDRDWVRERFDWAMDADLSEIAKEFDKDLMGTGGVVAENAVARLAWWTQRVWASGLSARHGDGFGAELNRQVRLGTVQELSEKVFGMLVEFAVEAKLNADSVAWATGLLNECRTINDRIDMIADWRISRSWDFRERIRSNGGVPTEWWEFKKYESYPVVQIVDRFE